MLPFLLSDLGIVLGLLLVLILIVPIVYLLIKITKLLFKFFVGIILNSIFGIFALLLLNIVGIHVPVVMPVILSIALFGLPALATVLIMLYFGVKIG